MSGSALRSNDAKVTRDDIEAKLRELRGEVDTLGSQAGQMALVAGGVAVVAVVAVAFLLGRRRGRRRTTVVEVRRV